MKELDATDCQVHVLVCVNERPDPKTCCHRVGGLDFYHALKERTKASGLAATLWITRTGCLGFCNVRGCTVVVYAKGQSPRWWNEVEMNHLPQLWETLCQLASPDQTYIPTLSQNSAPAGGPSGQPS